MLCDAQGATSDHGEPVLTSLQVRDISVDGKTTLEDLFRLSWDDYMTLLSWHVLVLQSGMVLVLVLVLRSSISKEDSRDENCITS